MIDECIFASISFPSPIESIFDKAVSIGWYDGTVSGLVLDSSRLLAFKFDLLDWDRAQEVRVFALSPLSIPGFEQAVKLLSELGTPNWPIWYPRWPTDLLGQSRMGSELEVILLCARSPEFAFASQSRFETILADRALTGYARELLPAIFDDQPKGGFDYWAKLLELPI